MNKKTFIAAIIISSFIISLITEIQTIPLAEANPIAYGPPRIAITSPQYGITYNYSQVTLSVGIQLFGYTYTSLEVISWARFAVDNGTTAPLNLDMPTVIASGTMINSTNIISNLTDGNHTVNVFLETSFGESAIANVTFIIDTKPRPTPTTSPTPKSTQTSDPSTSPPPTAKPPMVASLAESARSSYLIGYLGDTFNFTLNVEGGKEPYLFSWIVDNQTPESTTSPQFSANNLGIGTHSIFAIVTDADNNKSTTSSVYFYVLPNPSSTPGPSPTIPEFSSWLILPLVGVSILPVVILLGRVRRKNS